MPVIKSNQVPTSIAPFSMASIENQARQILLRAQQKAEQLLAAAQTESDALHRAAIEKGTTDGKRTGLAQGLEEGRKSGHDQALAEHREKFSAAITAISQSAAQFDASRGELESKGLRAAIELAASIARRVTKRQGMLDPQVMVANLQGAMKIVAHSADVRIAVHPTELKTLKDELPNLQKTWPQLQHVELIEDETLTRGGCRLFTASGAIDADLDGQLDRVIDLILPAPSPIPSPGTPGEG